MGANTSYCDTTNMVRFRSALRKLISATVIESFVYLGSKLEDNIVNQKMKIINNCEALNIEASLPVMNGKIEYERVEQRLW
jgi:hypothetical protein